MKIQLIMLPQPILVSDEKMTVGDFVFQQNFEATNNQIIELKTHFQTKTANDKNGSFTKRKIIAGIPILPSIDFSALSEKDCKKIGWVDVEKLALKECVCNTGDCVHVKSYTIGFKTVQSFNEKKFSLEELTTAFVKGVKDLPDLIQFLSQPKVFEVEVDMDVESPVEYKSERGSDAWKVAPKITNNSIKVLKVL